MPQGKVKGNFSVAAAAMAFIVLIFSVDMAYTSQKNNETYTKIIAIKEASVKSETLMKVLDEGIGAALYNGGNCKPVQPGLLTDPANENSVYKVLEKFNASINGKNSEGTANDGPTICEITRFEVIETVPARAIEADGEFECTIKTDDFTITAERLFIFDKENILSGGACTGIRDSVSRCIEFPGFDPNPCT